MATYRTKNAIELEILKLTKMKETKAGEDVSDYRKRLATACQEVSEEQWNSLSEEAQTWANEVIKAIKNEEDIPAPPGDEEEESDSKEEEEEGNASEEEEDEKPASKKGDKKTSSKKAEAKAPSKKAADKKPPAKAKDEPKAPAKKAAAGKKPKDDEENEPPKKQADKKKEPAKRASSDGKPKGAQVVIKELLIEDPQKSTDDLIADLKKKGLEPTRFAVSTIRSGMLQTLRILKEAGKLKGVSL